MSDLTPAEQAVVSAYLRAFITASPEMPIETIIAIARAELARPSGEPSCTH
jgi:hypothetical protein